MSGAKVADMGNNDDGRVAGSYTFAAQLPNGKTCTIQGYILAIDDFESLNKRMDMAAAVVERQRRIAEIPALEAKVQALEDQRRNIIVTADKLAGQKKVNGQESKFLDHHGADLRENEEQVARGRLALLEAKAFINNVGA